MQYKNTVLEAYIEPGKLVRAVKMLIDLQHPGYRDIQINEEFIERIQKRIP